MGRATINGSANRNNKAELSKKALGTQAVRDEALHEKAAAEPAGTYVYIGPSIPRGILKENALFRGKLSEIHAHLARDIARYPKVKMLIIPIDRLAEQKQRLANGGNALSNTYRELNAAFKKQ